MRNVTIPINGSEVDGYLALPASGSGPAVIVIQEWWGLVPHIINVADRLAAEGFVALAIDHYRGAQTTEPDEAQKLMMGLNIAQVADDLSQAAPWLLERPEVTSEKTGVIGFCMGGGLALLAPTVSDDICCAVAFYPAMPWPDYSPDWSRYAGKCALIHAAESDESWAGEAIASYTAAITSHGGKATVERYPDSEHAFFNDDRPEVFQPANAAAAWATSLPFLRGDCC